MRISHVHAYQDDDHAESKVVSLDISPEEYIDDLGMFEDKKQFVKFMFRQESLIRNSLEMEQYIELLKAKHGMGKCGVHPKVDREKGFRIELHHTPFTLFDIVGAVVNRRLQQGESMKMQFIAHEVMQLHYLDLCGLYPLCATCHLFQHSEKGSGFFIPIGDVWGDPKTFAKMYYPYFSDALKNKWDNYCVLDQGYSMIDNILPKELQKQYIYVQPIKDKEGSAVSTDKLIDFIMDLNTGTKLKPRKPKPVDPDHDADGFYILRRRYAS